MTEEEVWKPVVEFEGIYEVSNTGGVRGLDRVDARGWNRKARPLTPQKVGRKPYHYRVTLHKDSTRYVIYLHRVVADAFIPNPENLPYVLHWDDDPSNNSVENLHWGTHRDNMREMVERGRHVSLNAAKTHCPRNHEYTEENTLIKNGSRNCRECFRTLQNERRAKRTGIPEGDPRHGTRTGYASYRCRCKPCTDAALEYSRAYRLRKKEELARLEST